MLRAITAREYEELAELVRHPPKGSTIEAAKAYGVDLTLNLHALRLTPHERVVAMENALRFIEGLRRAVR
jgi:hypothetical protein